MATCSVDGCDRKVHAKGLCQRDYFRERRASVSAPEPPAARVPRHGTLSEYVNHKCRCPRCTRANTKYQRGRRASKGKVPA